MGKPACQGDSTFTNPRTATFEEYVNALNLCDECPIRRQCATAAMTAGSTLDGSMQAPASDVIAGGVACHGDELTLRKLAIVAGVAPAKPQRHRPRFKRPERCRHCHRHMTVRKEGQPTRGDQPTHVAHGYCRDCYKHLRKNGDLETRAHTTRDLLERTA